MFVFFYLKLEHLISVFIFEAHYGLYYDFNYVQVKLASNQHVNLSLSNGVCAQEGLAASPLTMQQKQVCIDMYSFFFRLLLPLFLLHTHTRKLLQSNRVIKPTLAEELKPVNDIVAEYTLNHFYTQMKQPT